MQRYVAFAWDPYSRESVHAFHMLRTVLHSRLGSWSIAYETANTLVVSKSTHPSTSSALTLPNGSGVILGSLFRSRILGAGTIQQGQLSEEENSRIAATGGRYLVDNYWGSYFALLYERAANRHIAFRDPIGNLPSFHTATKGIDIFFSHIEDCIHLTSLPFTVDLQYLTRWFFLSQQTTRATGLNGVDEIPGGESIVFGREHRSRITLWNPVETAQVPRFESVEQAAAEVRAVCQTTVDAWASCYRNIVLRLSGGLDSSILAACLANTPSEPQVTYLNFSPEVGIDHEPVYLPAMHDSDPRIIRALAGSGDERHYARLVSKRWNTPLIEKRRPPQLDLRRLWEVSLGTSPVMYTGMIQIEDVQIELTKTQATQAFFSGHGGDSVFLAATQPLGPIDYARQHGLSMDLWTHIIAAANANRESIWAVMKKVIKRGFVSHREDPSGRILTEPTLLSDDVVGRLAMRDTLGHMAEIVFESSLPPGKRNHVIGLAGSYHAVHRGADYADYIHPLNSQPVWDLALGIPTYVLLAGGTNRGLVRTAFADLLPSQIRNRQVKGSGTPFAQNLIRNNLDFFREHLSQGVLAREGIIDRQKVIRCFASEEPFLVANAPTILSCMAAEVWLQKWTDFQQRAAPLSMAF